MPSGDVVNRGYWTPGATNVGGRRGTIDQQRRRNNHKQRKEVNAGEGEEDQREKKRNGRLGINNGELDMAGGSGVGKTRLKRCEEDREEEGETIPRKDGGRIEVIAALRTPGVAEVERSCRERRLVMHLLNRPDGAEENKDDVGT